VSTHEDMPVPETPHRPFFLERWIEQTLSASRWLLAPFYLALAFSLLVLLVKLIQMLIEVVPHILSASESSVLLSVLSLIDLTLTGSLIVIVIFSGYENFVSRIDPSAHRTWPEWLAKIDFAGLKLKLMSSIVAISAIQLLRAFLNIANVTDRELYWSTGIHAVFVVSALLLALTDRFGTDTH
jgi:uncharacterized protein (TIGR00645 family)